MKKVVIGGGTGLVGSRLTDILMDNGYEVIHLSRSSSQDPKNWVKCIHWDIENQQLDPKDLEGISYIINLAGAGIADEKWTNERLAVIKNSRVQSNLLLKNTISKLEQKPEFFISASAIGYYGFRTSEKKFKETDSSGDDLMAEICVDWENSADSVSKEGIPTAKVRIGLVLSDEGGVLPKIEEPIRWGAGAALGSGKQYMPWIHIDDLCNIFIHILENGLEGTYNGVAPNPVNNKEFTEKLAKTIKKKIWLPNVPAFMIKLIMGSRADLVLKGSRVSSAKIEESGYKFLYKKLEKALTDLYFTT